MRAVSVSNGAGEWSIRIPIPLLLYDRRKPKYNAFWCAIQFVILPYSDRNNRGPIRAGMGHAAETRPASLTSTPRTANPLYRRDVLT